MPTIAIVDGVRIVLYPRDHLPPHLHAVFAEFEAKFSIATAEILEGSLPKEKAKSVRAWLMAHQGEVAHIWEELRAGRNTGGMIE